MIDLASQHLDIDGLNRLDDAGLWGRLAELTAHHPEWSDAEVRGTVQRLTLDRQIGPWRADVHAFWDRWKQHHVDLAAGLAAAGPMSWPEICSFCQVWTANRPIMSPFPGVARIVLDHAQLRRPQSAETEQPSRSHVTRTSGWRSDREVVVVSASEDRDDLAVDGASRQLIWALDESGAPWSLRQPWDPSAMPDPATTAAVMFWSYRHLDRDYVHHAMRLEQTSVALGIPVINSIVEGWDMRHSASLSRFQHAGIPCPQFQRFTDVDEIELRYPLILRADGLHRGRQMNLVTSPYEASKLVETARADFLASSRRPTKWARSAPSRARVLPPPNLAVEFVDISHGSGCSTKRRALVVGDRVIPRHELTSRHWLVNFGSSDWSDQSAEVHRRFVREGEQSTDLVARAGRSTGSDITALDYTRTADGRYVFWEANRIFALNGDPDYAVSVETAPATADARSRSNRRLGKALLSLLRKRIPALAAA